MPPVPAQPTATLDRLGSGADGLSTTEAEARLIQYGPNALTEQRVSPLRRLLSYLSGPIAWMIEAAALLSAVVGHWDDFTFILLLLFFNAGIGFYEEFQADTAVALLKRNLATTARVRRDGEWSSLPASALVPGDVVRVRLGDVVPADLMLLSGELEIDQAVVTGESLPVTVAAAGTAFSGTAVQRGEADAVVVATGMATAVGHTARLAQESKGVSHYQRAVLAIGRALILTAVAVVAVIVAVSALRGTAWAETITFALVLTVASIPVALPAVLSVTMAVGAVLLAAQKAIVSRLVSIEELAGMDVLCSDKTGTLTQNRLAVGEPILFGGATRQDALREAALASRREDGDPIDLAVLDALGADGGTPAATVDRFTPFDPASKRSEAQVHEGGTAFTVTKGAPQVILAICAEDAGGTAAVESAVDALAARGDRALGVARADGDGAFRFRAILPISDPPRPDSASMIAEARGLGVTVKMVTGDHSAIARQVAGELGLGSRIASASELFAAPDVDPEVVEQTDGFAEVFPEHKHRIVQILQAKGHFVGMTGDGVNDAPALKRADVGIAVSGATDVARGAADLVLTLPGLGVIVTAIQESRRIFGRMTSYATFRIAETIRVLFFTALAILLYARFPVTAAMIVILALLNDIPILMIAYDQAEVAARPTRWNMRTVLVRAAALGFTGVGFTFLLYWLGAGPLHLDPARLQTFIFLKLAVAGHMTIYLARTGDQPFWHRPLPAARLFFACEGTQVLATAFAAAGWLVTGIGLPLTLFVWGFSLCEIFFEDRAKIWASRLFATAGA